MSLIVQELCGSIKALNVVAKKIIQHQSKSCKVILSSKWKIDLGQYEQTTKFAKRQYSDIPSNGTCSMPNHYCLICGKSFFDSKALNLHISRTHMTSILQILRDDPMNTYKAIFGSENFKGESGGVLDFKNAMTITLEGKYKGMWKCWNDGTHGGPIKAIMKINPNLTFAQAAEEGAKIAKKLKHKSDEEVKVKDLHSLDTGKNNIVLKIDSNKVEQNRILAAQNIWQICNNLKGSLAEVYLVEHRHIPQELIPRLAFKFLPRDTLWSYTDYDKHGVPLQVKNRTPALVVPVKDMHNEVRGIQRIFLDKKSGEKSKQMKKVKLSKGVIRSAAGIVQPGQSNQILFLAEGPETGAFCGKL